MSDPIATPARRYKPGEQKVDFDHVRETRAERPESLMTTLQERKRRPFLRGDRRLMIIAADHTARGVFSTGSQSDVMSDRYQLLERLVLALSRPGVDGVLGTADILEDLALLGALHDKLAIGAVNRGGLADATFEIDDRLTGYDMDSIVRSGLDGAKILVRICLQDDRTADLLDLAARVVDAATAAKTPILLEPFMSSRRDDGKLVNELNAQAVSHSIAIASGLGGSSAYSWLKIPVVPEMERVMAATTLPTLLLGGDSPLDPERTYASWEEALRLPGVRGLVVGRSLLYPTDGDVAAHVDIATRLVHGAS
jgi:DhnA family fructose-bisphosphate aldolase class Ia